MKRGRIAVGKVKQALELIAICLIISLIVTLVDLIIILVFTREPNLVVPNLALITLIEGGLGLVTGGAIAFFSPAINKIGEGVFHSQPWDAKRQKEAERQGRNWIVTGILLVITGFLISAL
jgi:hypothetical protein